MEILSDKQYQKLMKFLPTIKRKQAGWQLINMRLDPAHTYGFNIKQAAEKAYSLHKEREGVLYLCSCREAFMLVRWEDKRRPLALVKQIEHALPMGCARVEVHDATEEGLLRLELIVDYSKTGQSPFAKVRRRRQANIVLVADDDMFTRLLIRKIVSPFAQVHEVSDGNLVQDAYIAYMPDIVFLDLHMPGHTGPQLLRQVLAADPDAYIVVVSGDDLPTNAHRILQLGAQRFITKPFSKEALLAALTECPTFTRRHLVSA